MSHSITKPIKRPKSAKISQEAIKKCQINPKGCSKRITKINKTTRLIRLNILLFCLIVHELSERIGKMREKMFEAVISGSSAESAGLHKHDVIVQCGGKVVQSLLQFFEIIWDNVGYPVDVVVVRADHNTSITLKLMVVEPAPNQLNNWPRWNSW